MIDDAPGGAIVTVRVIPRAGNTTVAGTRNDTLVVRLAAAPVDGAANAALITFLAGIIGIPKRQITIVARDKSRTKRVKVMA